MITKLCIENFKCFNKLELRCDQPVSLICGKPGTGKTTLGHVLKIFQNIGNHCSQVSELINVGDFRDQNKGKIQFDIDLLISDQKYHFCLVFEYKKEKSEIEVFTEYVTIADYPTYYRTKDSNLLKKFGQFAGSVNLTKDFGWHRIALPLISDGLNRTLFPLKKWLSSILVLSPIPENMTGAISNVTRESPLINPNGSNFSSWLMGILGLRPGLYSQIYQKLQLTMPDIQDFCAVSIGKNSKTLVVRFGLNQSEPSESELCIDFKHLSNCEKIFFVWAVIMTLQSQSDQDQYFCFWDGIDQYLPEELIRLLIQRNESLSDIKPKTGQIWVTSNSTNIEYFIQEAVFRFIRENHTTAVDLRFI